VKIKSLALLVVVLLVVTIAGCQPKEVAKKSIAYTSGPVALVARTVGRQFEVYQGGQWRNLLIKGVNLGTALPGRWFTQFPADRALYRSWLMDMSRMHVNVVRLYTLLDPAFYQVLLEYNSDPANRRIWLLQEIWPHDEVPNHNFHDPSYHQEYVNELKLVIDALHGNADIPGRPNRAYGNYSADVSPFVLGLLIGREFEPDEVKATNLLNPRMTSHNGSYVKAADASPTEVWIAQMTDIALAYASSTYQWQYPVGFVSWPTLDPLVHNSEWKHDQVPPGPDYNDREEVRPDRFSVGEGNKAGIFGAYHIYPNYPDFMNNESDFALYSDLEGTLRYAGYLRRFMSVHPPFPAVVAEFGISTSLNSSHKNPDGMHHGGLSEEHQGHMIVRMMRAIVAEGYAGGIIFAWTDEWAKKTWNTEPYMVPYERQVLWKNAMDPEQNYGIVSMESDIRPFQGRQYRSPVSHGTSVPGAGRIVSLEADVDEAFLYLAIGLDGIDRNGQIDWDKYGLMIGIDTGRIEAGEFILPALGVPRLPTGAEFLIDINSPEEASVLVVPSYNRGEFAFSAQPTAKGVFTRIQTIVNRERYTREGRRIAPEYEDQSRLNYGVFDVSRPEYFSLAHWYVDQATQKVLMRIPWMLLNVSDPSSAMIINDTARFTDHPARDQLRVEKTQGFLFYAVLHTKGATGPSAVDFEPKRGGQFYAAKPYLWALWETPSYIARLKRSYQVIANFFGSLP